MDNSGLTNYVTKTITAGSSYTLPVPTGYESEFLGWECKGEVITAASPTDNIVCTAKWNHKIKQQPTFLTPEISVSDKSYAKYQWKKTDAPTVYFTSPQYTIVTTVDNMVLFFDYSVSRDVDRYGSYPGYVKINGENLIYVASNDSKTYTGTMRFVCSKAGEYKITTDGASLSKMRLEHPATYLSGETSITLPYNYLTPNNGLYYCDITYKNEILHSDTLDTSLLLEQNENIYYPTSETTVALLKIDTNAKTCTIPQAVTNDGVSYNVTAISDYAFVDCVNLESIICMVPQPITVKASAFASVPSSLIIYVPSSKVNTYKAASVWKNYTIRAKDSYPAKLYNGNNLALDVTVNLPNKPLEATASNSMCFVDQKVRQTTEESNIIPNLVFKDDAGKWTAKVVDITDAQPLYSPTDVYCEEISYTRKYDNTKWQALYLPFSLSYDECKDEMEIAYFNNIHQYDTDGDGEIDRTTLEFFTQYGGELKPNTPYLARALNTGDVTLTGYGKTLSATPAKEGFVDCMSTKYYYKVAGIYQTKYDLYQNNQYAISISKGTFVRPTSSSTTVPPFRIYLDVQNRSGNGAMSKPHKIDIAIDGEVTGIEDVMIDGMDDGNYYDLQGRRVLIPSSGIYIQNGKKVIIK